MMAAQTGRLFQDANLNADFVGQKKVRGVGRKPLGDLSNTGKPINLGKPSVAKPSKHLKSQNLTSIVIGEAVSTKAKNPESNRTTANKASDKPRTRSSRKALSDISNSVKAHVPDIKNKNILKPPSSLRDEPFDLDAIAEEGFLHNHHKCIEAQSGGAMDMHHFFKTLGLENDLDDDLEISFELPAITKMKSESSHLELVEVPEHVLEDPLFAQPNSPGHWDSPKSSSSYTVWDEYAANLKLIDSPTKIV